MRRPAGGIVMITAPKFYGPFAPPVSAIHHICTRSFHRPKWGHLNPCRDAFAHSGPAVSGWGALFLEGGLPPPALGTLNERSMNGISGGFGDQVGRGLGMAPRCGGRRYQLVGVADADVAPLRRCNLRFPTPRRLQRLCGPLQARFGLWHAVLVGTRADDLAGSHLFAVRHQDPFNFRLAASPVRWCVRAFSVARRRRWGAQRGGIADSDKSPRGTF